jgi:hypothetical protein
MSKKHFIFAANQIAFHCYQEGIDEIRSQDLFLYYCSFFENFNEKFDREYFYKHIVKEINQYKADLISIEF